VTSIHCSTAVATVIDDFGCRFSSTCPCSRVSAFSASARDEQVSRTYWRLRVSGSIPVKTTARKLPEGSGSMWPRGRRARGGTVEPYDALIPRLIPRTATVAGVVREPAGRARCPQRDSNQMVAGSPRRRSSSRRPSLSQPLVTNGCRRRTGELSTTEKDDTVRTDPAGPVPRSANGHLKIGCRRRG